MKIWSAELNDPARLPEKQRNELYGLLVKHLRTLVCQRDDSSQRLLEERLASKQQGSNNSSSSSSSRLLSSENLTPEKNHSALEIAECKAKIRKANQEL